MMFASQLFNWKSSKFIVTTAFVRCKTKAILASRPTPFSDFIQDVDVKHYLVKFDKVAELHNAPEKVRKLFTLEYGNSQDKKERKIFDLINKIDSEKRCRVEVSKIVEITVSIKEKQETYLNKRKNNEHLIDEIVGLALTRVQLMDELRDRHYEVYVKALNFLNLEHYFKPQYDIRATALADEVADMRIRAFAEARRKAAIADKRQNKLLKLKEKYRKELTSSDNL